ncbi:MAG: nitroreductase family protein [Candidatus Aminicenantes bacterium]|nr:MAG: nitroreductase family protein [Candidatus Aminicenantes bacterium]
MEIPVQAWYEAIFRRRSYRKFKKIMLDVDKLGQLSSVCDNFRPFPEARSVLVREPAGQVYRGFLGLYGKIENAPVYVAFIGNMDSPRVQEAVGYTGQGIILEATGLELGTCWVGGFFYPEEVELQIPIAKNERVLAITPVGIPHDSFSFKEKLMTGFGYFHRRKQLSELMTGSPKKEWMKTALEAARLAPSAVNRQPWRFLLGDNTISVKLNKGRDTYKIARRLDCGIAMLHLELGARYSGVDGKWTFPPDSIACFVADSSL